jgi:FSR family fosmidomycin resistance protein-like MFS transporter
MKKPVEIKPRSFFLTTLPLYVFAHFSHHLLTALPIPLLVFIRDDFKLDATQAALVTSVFSMTYGIGQLPAGWLADHLGRKILLAVGILGVALAGVLVGFSATYAMLLVFLAIMGLAGGGYHPASTPMISASVEPKKRGRVLGIHGVGGSASYFLAPIIAAAIAAAWGWRSSFLILAIPTAVFGVIFFWLLRRQSAGNRAQSSAVSQTAGAEEAMAPGRWRRLIAFMALVVIGGGVAGAMGPFLALYYVDGFGLSKATAATLPAVANSAGLWASVAGGYLSDRVGRTPIIVGTFILGGVLLFLYGVVPWGLGFGALLAFSGISAYLRMPVSESFIIGLTTPKHRSTIYGFYYFANMETGARMAPVLGSYLVTTYGYETGFQIAGATVVGITLICAVFLWRNRD